LECLVCAPGYGNASSMGYCRPCCKNTETPESTQHRCEDCTRLSSIEETQAQSSTNFGHLLLTSLFVLLVGFGCYYCCIQRILYPNSSSDLAYVYFGKVCKH
jgi:hypothetical protein